ncbi:hypothetical protein D3C85_1446730 [compost metagenome]
MPPSAVLSDHAKVLNPGGEAGLPVYLTHHDAGLADREGEGRCHLCADGAIGSGMNPLGNLLNDAHAALLICRCLYGLLALAMAAIGGGLTLLPTIST